MNAMINNILKCKSEREVSIFFKMLAQLKLLKLWILFTEGMIGKNQELASL